VSSTRRFVLALVAAGVAVGAVVAITAAIAGHHDCGETTHQLGFTLGTAPPSDCEGLIRSLALRTGIAAGVATVLILLLMTGLLRTGQRIEEDRHTEAIERYREGRSNE